MTATGGRTRFEGSIGRSRTFASVSFRQLIAHFKMQRIPHEGAWFAPAYRDAAWSSIYGLATTEDFSALHRLKSDELWHYYGGQPLEMLLLYPDGRGETVVLGPDVFAGQRLQVVVPHGVWQGGLPVGGAAETYTFFGATVTPAFQDSHYEPGLRKELQARYPTFAAQIAVLARD